MELPERVYCDSVHVWMSDQSLLYKCVEYVRTDIVDTEMKRLLEFISVNQCTVSNIDLLWSIKSRGLYNLTPEQLFNESKK